MRILLADPQPNVRFALRALLERQPGVKVAGEASSVDTLLRQIRTRCPHLVLLDGDWRDGAAVDVLSALRKACPDLGVVVLSARPETRQLALDAGADGFVCKTDPPEALLAAVRSFQHADSDRMPHRMRGSVTAAGGGGETLGPAWASADERRG
jgi:DNA-binding NarL/FixJ family response regulator